MRLKRIYSVGLTLIIALAGLLSLAPQTAFALPTCEWTGGGGDDNFSTAANWTNCNSAAPQVGYPLSFGAVPASQLTANNDLSGYYFGDITFGGPDSGNFTITGDGLGIDEQLTAVSSTGSYNYNITAPVTLSDGAEVDGSTAWQEGGSFSISSLTSYADAAVNVNDATVSYLTASDGSTVNLAGDTIAGYISGGDTTTIINIGASNTIAGSSTSYATYNVNNNFTISGTFYAGEINVANGVTLIVNGTVNNASHVTVDNGGTLKGTGSFHNSESGGAVVVNQGGTLAPGHSPGCLTTDTVYISGTYQEELGGANTACTDFDQLIATNQVNITNGTLNIALVNGFTPTIGQTFKIIDNQGVGSVLGTFSGLPEGATVSAGGYDYKISYVGGDGNDVTLTALGPTPASSASSSSNSSSTSGPAAPAAPDTGLAALTAHPLATLITTTVAALMIAIIARRLRPLTVSSSPIK